MSAPKRVWAHISLQLWTQWSRGPDDIEYIRADVLDRIRERAKGMINPRFWPAFDALVDEETK